MGDVFVHHVTGTIKLVISDLIIQANKQPDIEKTNRDCQRSVTEFGGIDRSRDATQTNFSIHMIVQYNQTAKSRRREVNLRLSEIPQSSELVTR